MANEWAKAEHEVAAPTESAPPLRQLAPPLVEIFLGIVRMIDSP